MEYGGEDNLITMKLAKNYNSFLVGDVIHKVPSTAQVIVDFGSGDGYFADRIEKRLNKKIICIEPSQNLQKYYQNAPPLNSLDELSNNSVDCIYSMNVLEHIEDDQAVIEKMHKKLKIGGVLYLYLPALKLLYSSMDRQVGHYRRYTLACMKKRLDDKKWDLIENYYADFGGFFVTLLFKFLGSKSGKINPLALKVYDRFLFPLSFLLDRITAGKIIGKNLITVAIKKR